MSEHGARGPGSVSVPLVPLVSPSSLGSCPLLPLGFLFCSLDGRYSATMLTPRFLSQRRNRLAKCRGCGEAQSVLPGPPASGVGGGILVCTGAWLQRETGTGISVLCHPPAAGRAHPMVLPLGDPPALVTLKSGQGCGLHPGILCAQRGGQHACVERRAWGAGPKPCSAGESLTRRGWGKCGQVAGKPLGQCILPWAQTVRGREGSWGPGTLSGELPGVTQAPPNQQDPTVTMGHHSPAAGVGTGTTFGPRG